MKWVILLEGPYDVIHDVIVCKSYVFADSQGTRLRLQTKTPEKEYVNMASQAEC